MVGTWNSLIQPSPPAAASVSPRLSTVVNGFSEVPVPSTCDRDTEADYFLCDRWRSA